MSFLALATVATALTIAGPAAAQTTEPPLVTKAFYFECQGTNKVQNSIATITPTWSETKPAQSFQSGAGCGFFDVGSLSGMEGTHPTVDATFGGVWDERVKTMTVELHELLLGQTVAAVNADALVFQVMVAVDGQLLTPVEGLEVKPTQTISSTGVSESVKFGITFNKQLPLAPDGREFVIGINGGYLNANYAWVFGASEVPAGVVFNPTKPAVPGIKIEN